MRSVAPGETVTLSTERGLAFGRVILLENGKEKIPYRAWLRRANPVLKLVHLESGREASMRVEQNGNFYWSLPKGTYDVNELKVGCDYLVRPQLTFEVPPQADISYLGTLKVDVDVYGLWWWGSGGSWWITDIRSRDILDESEKAAEMLRGYNPTTVSHRIDKMLLRKISGLPPTMKNLTFLRC